MTLVIRSYTKMDFTSLILCTMCIAVICKVISILHHRYVFRRKLKNIPEDYGHPVIGMTYKLMQMTEQERVEYFITRVQKFKEGIFLQWIADQALVFVFKPEFLEIILPSTINIEKGRPYELLDSWLGKGLLTSTGKQWFHDRKLIGPTFHFSILDQFAVVISEKAEILVKCLEKEIAKNPMRAFDFLPFAVNVTLDIICETAMGVNIHAQENETKYARIIHRKIAVWHFPSVICTFNDIYTLRVTTLTMERFLRPWYWIDWLYYYLMPTGREYKSILNQLHGFTKEVIKRKKAARQSQNNYSQLENENDELDIGKRKRKAFLDLLLDQNEKDETPLTDDELRNQVDTFMFEGHDTTAVALTWVLFALGNRLEHQEKVHEELEEVFKDSQAPATVKELTQLKYLDRVIKESLRIAPSVPLITRKLAKDVKLGDYRVPKHTTMVIGVVLTHINPQVWPEPFKFDPDRFLPENSKHRHPYAYIPFSAGPRNCIGQRFALLEEKIILTAILRKWRVKSIIAAESITYSASFILRPGQEVLLHFTPKK